MPKVSIVLPTYNGENYIRESIESIIMQTFEDWELIIVNDSSLDNTPLIINEYAERDSRIKIINNEKNQKLPKSLNIGFSYAEGDYFTWTSDDNVYLPKALEVMTQYLDKNELCPMVCTAMKLIDNEGKVGGQFAEYTFEKMLLNNCVGACFMYRSSVRKDIGEYDVHRFLVEDYDYWLRILFRYGRIDYLNNILYLYRMHNASLSETRQAEIREQLIKLREKYIKNIIIGLKDREDLLYQIYYEFIVQNHCTNEIKKIFSEAIPKLGLEKERKPEKPLIIYGAGMCGRKAAEVYRPQVLYFMDCNSDLVGNKVDGIEVISIKNIQQYKKECSIMIAVSPAGVYSCIEVLKNHGIEKYFIYLTGNIILYNEN